MTERLDHVPREYKSKPLWREIAIWAYNFAGYSNSMDSFAGATLLISHTFGWDPLLSLKPQKIARI